MATLAGQGEWGGGSRRHASVSQGGHLSRGHLELLQHPR